MESVFYVQDLLVKYSYLKSNAQSSINPLA